MIPDDPSGPVYFCDASEHYIGVRNPAAPDHVLAGTPGTPGIINASCRKARFHGPRAVAHDPALRVLYIADTGNQAVRHIDLGVHIVNTLVDHHDARAAAGVPEFTPGGLALDGDGLLAIADIKNHIVWAYDLRRHHLRLLAGSPGQHGLTDGDGPGARFWLPTTIALADDGSGFLVAEAGNRQRRLVTRDGRVRTLAR
jgi:sugar lactone lactonase YvrE